MITATATLTETISVTASLGGIVCLAATYTLVDTDVPPNILDSGSIASGAAETIVAPAASVTVNTAPFDTAPSGGSLNVPVINGGSNPVGSKQGIDWVIDNNATFINGTQVTDQEAEIDANIFVTLDGTQSGTWNAGTQTWEVIGAACADANLEINGVQQETIASGATFNLIATLDGVAGGSYNAGTNTLSFTSNTGWIRNPDWPAMPTPAAEQFIGLLAVFENRTNRITMTVNGVSLVDYGDGTTVNSNGTAQLKTYDYATLAQPVYVDPITGENYKMVLVTITRIAANITDITFTGGIQNWLDIYAALPNATNLNFVVSNRPLYLCERMRILTLSASYNTPERLVVGSLGLRVFEFPFGSVNTWYVILNLAGPIDDLGDITGSASVVAGTFAAGRIQRIGTVTNNTATSWNAICDQMPLLHTIVALVSSSATTAIAAFRLCPRLRGAITINCPALQNATQMFMNSPLIEEITFTNAAALTTTTSMFDGCYYLGNLVMTGLTRGVNLASTNLGNYGMSAFANSIGTAAGAQTITVTGTPFGALLTALDATALAIRLVMTGKGYTVAN